jgi:hypothetical protein
MAAWCVGRWLIAGNCPDPRRLATPPVAPCA